MLKNFFIIVSIFILCGCELNSHKTIAIVDAQKIISTSPHLKEAQEQKNKAKEIYQYNLSTIEKKLSQYKDRKMAEAFLIEAQRQLQNQFNITSALIDEALRHALQKAATTAGAQFDVVLAKGNIVLANKDSMDITYEVQPVFDKLTVEFPAMPQTIDDPKLPPDTAGSTPLPENAHEKTPANKK